MFKSEISQRKKVILFILLIVLNIILRIPSIPHEKGHDSFFIHSLANSITYYGHANWCLNWLSVFGLFPYTYASSVPFSLSGISQLTGLTGLEMEKTILIFSIFMGLFSVFVAYILAGAIYNDFIFKYLTAFFFSISQGVMVFTTWEISTRGPFIVFFPIFIWVLLENIKLIKALSLMIITGVYLAATHHFFYFLLPISFTLLILKLISRISLMRISLAVNAQSKNLRNYYSYIYIITLMALFTYPFFTGTMIEAGSRYQWLMVMLIGNVRYTGPVLIFFFGGLISLTFKEDKKLVEWYILWSLAIFSITLYDLAYGMFIILIFVIILIAIGFRNLFSLYERKAYHNKALTSVIVLVLISSAVFSGFYNNERTGGSKELWYMQEDMYKAAVWSNNYIPSYAHGLVLGEDAKRLIAASDAHPIAPMGGAQILAYELMNESDIQLVPVSSNSLSYYYDGPYTVKQYSGLDSVLNAYPWIVDIDYEGAKAIERVFNATYLLDDVLEPQVITESLEAKKNKVFDNGRIRIWTL